MMQQHLPLVDPKTLAKSGDPRPSHLAAAELASDPERLGKLQVWALCCVRANPGWTCSELAEKEGVRDPRSIGRRLSELERKGFIYRSGDRICRVTLKVAGTWTAVES